MGGISKKSCQTHRNVTDYHDEERVPLLDINDVACAPPVPGTVRLGGDVTLYIPTPTADPRDPLNMETWHKLIVVIVVSLSSTIGMSLLSGFGGLLVFYTPQYAAAGKSDTDVTTLMTYPILCMGIGNLMGLPVAIAVGRRIVLLIATITLLFSTLLCTMARSFEEHLLARLLLGLAAGQCESIGPMVIQEIHFLHERSKALMIQQTVQVVGSTVWVLCAGPIATAFSPQCWYGLGAVLMLFQFVLVVLFVPETRYKRPTQPPTPVGGVEQNFDTQLSTYRPTLDHDAYAARTWKSDLQLWVGRPQWYEAIAVLKIGAKMLFFPNVLWSISLCGFTLAINVALATTYGKIVMSPPYDWNSSKVSFITGGQIVMAVVALPILGTGSDKLIKWRAKLNDGIHEPETRLLSVILPVIIGFGTTILYGRAASHPFQYHWLVYVWCLAANFFTFMGASISTITFLLDSYPAFAGSVLTIVCASRGLFSFIICLGLTSSIQTRGYEGTFSLSSVVICLLGLLGLPIFHYGKQIRAFTVRFLPG